MRQFRALSKDSIRYGSRKVGGRADFHRSTLVHHTDMQFPLELVHHVVHYLVFESGGSSQEQEVNIKPPWSSVDGFSQSSRAYRAVLLEHWFQRLYLTCASDLTSHDFPEINTKWTKCALLSHLILPFAYRLI